MRGPRNSAKEFSLISSYAQKFSAREANTSGIIRSFNIMIEIYIPKVTRLKIITHSHIHAAFFVRLEIDRHSKCIINDGSEFIKIMI